MGLSMLAAFTQAKKFIEDGETAKAKAKEILHGSIGNIMTPVIQECNDLPELSKLGRVRFYTHDYNGSTNAVSVAVAIGNVRIQDVTFNMGENESLMIEYKDSSKRFCVSDPEVMDDLKRNIASGIVRYVKNPEFQKESLLTIDLP